MPGQCSILKLVGLALIALAVLCSGVERFDSFISDRDTAAYVASDASDAGQFLGQSSETDDSDDPLEAVWLTSVTLDSILAWPSMVDLDDGADRPLMPIPPPLHA